MYPMAEELKKQKSEKGDVVAMHSHKMIVVKWQDEKQVTVLTIHNIGVVDTGKTSRKTGNQPRNHSLSWTITE
jgi:hypothetical protein